MKTAITHRPDDTYIEKAWKYAEMRDIEDRAADIQGNQEKAKAWRMICFTFFILLSDAASKRPLVATG